MTQPSPKEEAPKPEKKPSKWAKLLEKIGIAVGEAKFDQ